MRRTFTERPDDASPVDEAAAVDHGAVAGDVPGRDGGPQDPDDMRAADGLSAPQSVSDEYSDMLDKGAKQRGEGRVP
ncbi:MAG TPA: hypothetical protein VFJ17_10665 [Mycobacteriales bacterium]|jgi:hypothetical protein|nr:hypothetical protein [Mycobacteriales bacterium]